MKSQPSDAIKLFREALSEGGVHTFAPYGPDQPQINKLCDFIGILHRELESKGYTPEAIEAIIEASHEHHHSP